MKTRAFQYIFRRWIAAAFCLAAAFNLCAAKEAPLPLGNPAVEALIATTNLQAAAAAATDPDVWLGLAMLPQPGDPLRRELLDKAAQVRPECKTVAQIIAVAMDGPDAAGASALAAVAPENALGCYLQGALAFKSTDKKAALEAFRNAAKRSQLLIYDRGSVSNALFKALDALSLKGQNRLWVSSWTATRWINFEYGNLQGLADILRQLPSKADGIPQSEIADMELILAGHLVSGDAMLGHVFCRRALIQAFSLKTGLAGRDKSPLAAGYAAASMAVDDAGASVTNPAAFLPSRIWEALQIMAPESADPSFLPKLTDQDRAVYAKARAAAAPGAQTLVEAVLSHQNAIIGAYFNGIKSEAPNAPEWVNAEMRTEQLRRLNRSWPEVFTALAAFDEKSRAFTLAENMAKYKAEQSTVTSAQICATRLRQIDQAKQQWALELGKQASDTPAWDDLKRFFGGTVPQCPDGGTYSPGSITRKPKCSVEGHVCP